MYESFFTNKRYLTFNDFTLLSKRKEIEKEIINKENNSNDHKVNSYFFIEENWIQNWEYFIMNKTKEYSLQTNFDPRKISFIPYPGLISNENLINDDGSIRDGISPQSYRALNPEVWNQLFFTYKGGPEIHRESNSIFSNEIDLNSIRTEIQHKIDFIIYKNTEKQREIWMLKKKEDLAKIELDEIKQQYILMIKKFLSGSFPENKELFKNTK